MQRWCSILILVLVGAAWTHGSRAYLGFAVTRGYPNTTADTTNVQVMSRTMFYVRSTPTDGKLKLLDGNWYVNGNNQELGSGGTLTETASLEYPLGTCTQIKWGGSSSVTINNGSDVVSDAVTAPPVGSLAAIRRYVVASHASVLTESLGNAADSTLGDATHYGASGISDQTVSCDTVTNTATGDASFPLGLIGQIQAPSVCIIGDSIASGEGATPNTLGDVGIVATSIGPSLGYINMSYTGTTAANYVTNSSQRSALYKYCTHLISQYGTNDLYVSGATAGQLETSLTSIYNAATNLVSPAVIFQTTLIPRTTSTDSWATTVNQSYLTSPAAGESARETFNSALRASSFGPNGGFFDVDSPLEVAPLNSGWWVNVAAGYTSCSPWTADGTHANNCALGVVVSSGVIATSRIHFP